MFKQRRFSHLILFASFFCFQFLPIQASVFPDNYYEDGGDCALCSRLVSMGRYHTKCKRLIKAIDPDRLTSNPIPFIDKEIEVIGYVTEIQRMGNGLILNFVPGNNYNSLMYLRSNFVFTAPASSFETVFQMKKHCDEKVGCVRLVGRLKQLENFYVCFISECESLWFNLHVSGDDYSCPFFF